MGRKELLLNNTFFKNKENLVDAILLNESNYKITLPNKFAYKQTSPLTINEKNITLLRIENFYVLEISDVPDTASSNYKIFENEIAIRKFFINNNPDDSSLNFWLRQLELICD